METKPKPNEVTTQHIAAAVEIAAAVCEAIQAAKVVSSGELYAMLMGKMSIETYEALIQTLVRTKLVHRTAGHTLVWMGPAREGN